MRHLANLHVLVLGLGDSGLAMARWCARGGAARITVADTREAPPQAAALAADVPAATLRCGPFEASLLDDGVQLVLRSPGLSPQQPELAALLAAAAQRGVAVQGELALFARALEDLRAERGYRPRVLAITGTNGKTTTAAMTALLVERTGARVGLAGNIGPTMLDTLGAALDREPAPPPEAPGVAGETAVAAVGVDALPAGAAAAAAGAAAASQATVAVDDAPGPVGDEEAGDLAALAADGAAALADDTAADGAAGEDGGTPAEAEAHADAEAQAATTDAAGAAQAPPADESLDLAGGGPPPHLVPPPPPDPVFQHLPQVWVLELSSFQLDGVERFEPTAAAVLNVTQDHLDWHGTMDAYATAKARIFGSQGVMVVNRDDPAVEAMVPAPQVIKGRGKGARARTVQRRVVRFSLDAPTRPGDFGVVRQGGMAWLARAHPGDAAAEASAVRRGAPAAPAEEDLHIQRLMPADALRVRGRHNAANALAALALATSAGLPLAPMLHGLREYRGEPHRVAYLGSVGGIEAYDDSKGTNVGATVAAIAGLGADKAPARLVLILGGDGKGQDFSPLATPVARYVRAVALIGRDAAAIEAALQGSGAVLAHHASLEDATRWSFEQARGGDAVLLSPACASLDMFRNYAHRAQVFSDTVALLGAQRGEVAA